MFFHRLNEEQRAAFLALTIKMLLADGKVMPEEEEFLESLRRELGVAVRAPASDIFGSARVEAFDTREAQVVAALGLLVMGYVDRHFHIDETEVFHEICAKFGFDAATVAGMKDWARRQAALLTEFDGFVRV